MSNKNFMQKCLSGEIIAPELDEAFDDAIDEWHESDGKTPIYEFLGMPKEYYDLVVEKPEFLSFLVFMKQNHLELDETQNIFNSTTYELAARGVNSQSGKAILKWLRIKGMI